MGSAYTPGLTVSRDTVVRRTRRLPIKGEVLGTQGSTVNATDVIARADLPGPLQTIKFAEKLGVSAAEVPARFKKKEGDVLEVGEVIGEYTGFFAKLFRTPPLTAEIGGTIEGISQITGNVLVRQPSIPVELTAYIDGTVVEVMPEEGIIVEARGSMVQGIFGVGGERRGKIRCAVSSPDEVLEASHILADHAGEILIGGSGLTYEALEKAHEIGVVGIVVGAVRDVDLMKFLGYDIGVAITGQEKINLTLMATEGFGQLPMAERTFNLLKSLEGQEASMNGATQIRAGVIRPELIVSHAVTPAETGAAEQVLSLEPGTPIRVIREPYFGLLGKVTGLPSQLVTVDSGAEVRVLEARLDDGREVTVPRANVEIIATQ
ncbi:MAG: hypothetical protein KF812_10070 [Fimbriimonadaceae bacterium]|nr:hypothetical protein [Fimbriimonadaceae bacterium]